MNKAEAWGALRAATGNAAGRGDPFGYEWLVRCLECNAGTEFGRKYGFDSLKTPEDYARAVPAADYEAFRPYVERMAQGEPDLLFAGPPLAFELTSGSSAASKLIPYSAHSLDDFRRALLPWLGALIKKRQLSGSLYWSISPALRRPDRTKGGLPIGLSDADYLGPGIAPALAALSAVPFSAGGVRDREDWLALTLFHLLKAHDLCFVSVWSPTFFTMLLDGLDERAGDLLELLRQGGVVAGHALAPDRSASLRLESWLIGRDSALLWPGLKLVSAWADASSAPYARELQKRLPHAAFQAKGLLCTEAAITVPDEDGRPLLQDGCGFVEFMDVTGRYIHAEQLKKNTEYRVVLTNAGGLYRYYSGDAVICNGYCGSSPILRFAGRLGLTSDLAGEKLTEAFVNRCLSGFSGFCMLVPLPGAPGGPGPGYALVTEKPPARSAALLDRLEAALSANPHYAYARKVGQLSALRLIVAPRARARYLDWAAGPGRRAGAGLGVLKIPALCAETGWLEDAGAA